MCCAQNRVEATTVVQTRVERLAADAVARVTMMTTTSETLAASSRAQAVRRRPTATRWPPLPSWLPASRPPPFTTRGSTYVRRAPNHRYVLTTVAPVATSAVGRDCVEFYAF